MSYWTVTVTEVVRVSAAEAAVTVRVYVPGVVPSRTGGGGAVPPPPQLQHRAMNISAPATRRSGHRIRPDRLCAQPSSCGAVILPNASAARSQASRSKPGRCPPLGNAIPDGGAARESAVVVTVSVDVMVFDPSSAADAGESEHVAAFGAPEQASVMVS